MKLTLEEIIKATDAKIIKGKGLAGPFSFSTDTRTIKNGEIYLPLKGENFDGENFIEKALEAGAVGCFISKKNNTDFEEGCKEKAARFYSKKALENAQLLRKNLTNAEAFLWYFLKAKQLGGYKFRKQSPIGSYIVDFICFEKKLIVELDGGHHTEKDILKYDEKRNNYLKTSGYNILRFYNNEIFENIEGVLNTILSSINPSQKSNISTLPQGEGNQPKLILEVEDTLTAYLQLARFYRNKVNPKTIAITGSSGKTTTKEMAYCVSKEKFKTHKSELNFNNEIGLCKTILSMPEDTEVLILEMGMRGLKEIELLSKYSEPDISIIANVGTAHIGRLGSRENIAKAKCEIVKHQKKEGILIAHDDEMIKNEIKSPAYCVVERSEATKQSKKTFISWIATLLSSARNDKFDVKPFNSSTIQPIYFSLKNTKIIERKVGYSKFEYKNNIYELNIEGDYNIQNALAVIEMGLVLGIEPSKINEGLKKYSPIEKRWEIEEIKGFKIINDSYNANPESMKAVIDAFLSLYSPPLAIVLGNMGELGENEIQFHKEVGDFLCEKMQELKNVKIITIGNLANEIAKKLNNKGVSAENFENNRDAACYILDNVENGTTIILKASRSMKFEEILEKLKADKKQGE